MKTHAIFSGVAVATLMLAIAPAAAVSLDVGGSGGLVSLGSGDSGSSGSDSSGSGVSVDVDADAGVNVDIDSGSDTTTDLFGSGKPLVKTGGDGGLVTVDTDDDADALVTLFGTSDGGSPEQQAVEADVLSPDRDEEVFVQLFGGGANDITATVDLDDGNGGLDQDVMIDLFGPSSGNNAGTGGSGPSASNGGSAAGNGGGAGGPGVDGTHTGSTAGNGGSNGLTTTGRVAPGSAGARVAATGGATARSDCFSPDQGQIDYLLGRTDFAPGDVANWQQAQSVSIVPVNLCPDAKARLDAALDADADVQQLRTAVAEVPMLSAELDPSYGPEDVLAVDQSGQALTVYVY